MVQEFVQSPTVVCRFQEPWTVVDEIQELG